MTTFEERGDREHLGAGYDALTAPPMNPYLQHRLLMGPRPGAGTRRSNEHRTKLTQDSSASGSCRGAVVDRDQSHRDRALRHMIRRD
jgi:hypothetical protein